jgi:anti-anti-sigma factor
VAIDATPIRPQGCRISYKAGIPVVSLPDAIDIANDFMLRSALLDACIGASLVVVDLTATRHFGATGVNVIVSVGKRLRAVGGDLRLVVPSSHIRRTLEVLKIDQCFDIFMNVPDALTSERLLPYKQAA